MPWAGAYHPSRVMLSLALHNEHPSSLCVVARKTWKGVV